ncbi:MAG: hypothetical protein E7I45_13265, partial [Eikenella corrodens]|uniref:hypothetical protein n=1 Tax=Eikenella corrodens TaxID=539 RepID=UPI002909DDD7
MVTACCAVSPLSDTTVGAEAAAAFSPSAYAQLAESAKVQAKASLLYEKFILIPPLSGCFFQFESQEDA